MLDRLPVGQSQPEVVVGTWLAARGEEADMTEDGMRAALERLEPLWVELFAAEQARIVARAFRWRRMLETGQYATVKDLAAAEKINASYVCRVLRLTLLAPDLVEAILDGRQPAGLGCRCS